MNAYLEFNPDVFRNKTILLPCDDPEWSNFTKYFAQNFENFGLRKLISTSYAADSKSPDIPYQPTLFERGDKKFDKKKTRSHGKIFILEKDKNGNDKINIEDLEWDYLEDDGDFRSEEVTKLRDEADFIITNPPFSLFKEFLAWLLDGDKFFSIIANKNCVTYKEVFPLIRSNKIWSGREEWSGGMWFKTISNAVDYDKIVDEEKFKNIPSIWITNIDHGRRHEPIPLMSLDDNIKFTRHKDDERWANAYKKYDNYDAIEVPFTDAIPSDYKEVMGVPITFLDKYCPEQFEILGCSDNGIIDEKYKLPHFKRHNEPYVNGGKLYKRLFIKYKEVVG